MSWNKFRTNLLEGVRGRLWAQWSALGARSTARYKPVTVDLETLLLGTFSYGRTDPRLFDEALSWCCQFGELVNPNRLKKLLAEVSERSTTRMAGAWEEAVSEHSGVNWNLNIDVPQSPDSLENVFFTEAFEAQPTGPRRDAIFEKWGFARGPFEPRHHSAAPDLSDLQLTQLFARKFMGGGCRSEVFAILLLGVDATTTEFADMTMYSRRLIQTILSDLNDAGMLDWDPSRGRTTRARLHKRTLQKFQSLITRDAPLGDPYGRFEIRDWPGFFLGLHALWRAIIRIERSGLGGFKAQTLLRDALEEATTYHRRTSLTAVYGPELAADSMEELIREAQLYLDSLMIEDSSVDGDRSMASL